MSEMTNRHPITLKRVVYRIAGMESVPVRRDVEYASGNPGPLLLDLYYPPAAPDDAPTPAVVLVTGYRDVGVPLTLGCSFKEMAMTVSLAQLLAVSGMIAVAYSTRQPATDIDLVLAHLEDHADRLRVDPRRLGLWAGSGNVPVALAALMRHGGGRLKAAVLSNGFTLDIAGTAVADAARRYGFANAAAGTTVDDLPADVALFLVRSGLDEFAGLNEALGRFVAGALARNLPITVVNHATGTHAFELHDDSETARQIISQTLAFMRHRLSV